MFCIYRDIQTSSKHTAGCSNIWGHPNIQGASKCMGTYGHSCSVTKHAFFVLSMYWGHPNIIQTYRGCPNIQNICGIQTYRWCIQTYGGIQTYRGCPNIKGGTQTYGSCPNIWGHQNIQGPSKHCSRLKSVASSDTHMGATKHTGGHPNIQWGIQIYGWCPNIWASKHMGGVQTWGHANIQGMSKHGGIQTYRGCPNLGASKHKGCIHTYGGIQIYGVHGHPLSVT